MDFPDDKPAQNTKRYKVTLEESQKRRVELRNLLANGIEREVVYAHMSATFAMSEAGVDRLIDELNADDEKHEASNLKHRKRRQLHRLRQIAAKAIQKEQLGPAVKAEELIAEIEGNTAAQETRTDVAAVLTGALAGMLSEMSEDRVRALLEKRARREALELAPTPGARLLGPKVTDAEFDTA